MSELGEHGNSDPTPPDRTELSDRLAGWQPPPVRSTSIIALDRALALAATIDADISAEVGTGTLPPFWHWLYFLDWPPASALGPDGHPREGGFLPPLPDRRRMFAGGRLRCLHPVRLDEAAERVSSVADVQVKHGRSGALAFVTVRSEISQDGRVVIVDEQDLVYRSGPAIASSADSPGHPAAPPPPRPSSTWQQSFQADPITLFRFSALTANAHRIHYDRPYAIDVEGHGGLVVHGPLLIVLMAELLRREQPDASISAVDYRLKRPVLAGEPVEIVADRQSSDVAVAVVGPEGRVRAEATISAAGLGDD